MGGPMEPLAQLTLIVLLGMLGQFLGAKLRIPSILLLLGFGFLAGPILGWLQPSPLPDDLIRPVVGLGVAIILFEGGLGLNFREIAGVGRVVLRLVSAGVLITWALLSGAAFYLLQLPFELSILLGAILVLSGPTVVLPLLRQIRPQKEVERVLRWEGIVIDPIGALLAAVVFETLLHGLSETTWRDLVPSIGNTVVAGVIVAGVMVVAIVVLERFFLVPDYLRDEIGLGIVLGGYTLSELIAPEAGVFAVTLAGIGLANQRLVSVRHLLDFKETLSLLAIGTLFILLSSRLELSALELVDGMFLGFLMVTILVARPLSVAVSTLGSRFTWRERALMAWLAPRGIVAAAVSAFFALRLQSRGAEGADLLVAYVFLTIIATALLYGLTARPLAKLLGVTEPSGRGVLIWGCNVVSKAIAKSLQDQDIRVLIVSSDLQAVTSAKVDGLEAVHATLNDRDLDDKVDLRGIGRMWAMTANEETNSLACLHYVEEVGRKRVFQLRIADPNQREHHLHGRTLFGDEINYDRLRERMRGDTHELRRTKITEEFNREAYDAQHPDAIPLFAIQHGRIRTFSAERRNRFEPGQTIVSIVPKTASPPQVP